MEFMTQMLLYLHQLAMCANRLQGAGKKKLQPKDKSSRIKSVAMAAENQRKLSHLCMMAQDGLCPRVDPDPAPHKDIPCSLETSRHKE